MEEMGGPFGTHQSARIARTTCLALLLGGRPCWQRRSQSQRGSPATRHEPCLPHCAALPTEACLLAPRARRREQVPGYTPTDPEASCNDRSESAVNSLVSVPDLARSTPTPA